MLISTISTAEKNYTPMSLLGAQIAYDDATQPRIKLLEEEKDGNGFAALMLSRCYKLDFADCKKDRAMAEQYEKTLPLIQSKLEQLDTSLALAWLGSLYLDKGTQRDLVKGLSLIKKAAENDDDPSSYAKFRMGYLYEKGIPQVLDPDIHKAIEYYKAAETGNYTAAMYNLGAIYSYGREGFEPDFKFGVQWFEKAASFGDVDALYELSEIYIPSSALESTLWGVSPLKNQQAIDYLEEAAKKGSKKAINKLTFLVIRTQTWAAPAIALGNYRLEIQDYPEAYKLFAHAVKFDRNKDILRELAAMNYAGLGTQKNYQQAFEYYEAAKANSCVAFMSFHGQGTSRNYDKAFNIYSKLNEDEDNLNLAYMIYNNIGNNGRYTTSYADQLVNEYYDSRYDVDEKPDVKYLRPKDIIKPKGCFYNS